MQVHRFAIGLAAIIAAASPARAEWCDMAGCPGPGYIFIPMTTQDTAFFYGGLRCTLPGDGQTFDPDGLPAVNSEVKIVRTASLYDDSMLADHADDFVPPEMKPSSDGKSCTVTWHEPESGQLFRTHSDMVRILGYRTVTQHYSVHEPAFDAPTTSHPARVFTRQILFALVTTLPAPLSPAAHVHKKVRPQ
jgi:hypothetical protein